MKYKIQKIWEKGQSQGEIDPGETIELSCAAEERRSSGDEKSTSIYDLEVIISWDGGDPISAAAINCKFSYLEGQSFKMSPENMHKNPYLFVCLPHYVQYMKIFLMFPTRYNNYHLSHLI